ncbi:TPA: hypothetical protein ACIFCT_003563 [Acinetobacter baumannii]|uniref:hypothetical protein n=1 Tax=Acinetobacter calcoaceticus/baumannii complex TaxID=909768 RepID=UPI00035F07D3|nr:MULTISPECIES: hypothetical protein [Acinetobacter calcoaceticus/baumannii complex]MBZ0355229.1 hypothetical protein [Acinetobacter baumannii]MDQ9038449.1 hypothetical protein [Acinetobacter seifertii]MDR5636961.1 hypothetical protein [Acinetobacter baumannii]MDR8256530.1 hypothetical protein [Acinetobacter baumannii]MDT1826808.1 hypothetical protein [Acinetobacter baumannii]
MKVVHIKINPNKAILQITWYLVWSLVSIALIKRFDHLSESLLTVILFILFWSIILIIGIKIINALVKKVESPKK